MMQRERAHRERANESLRKARVFRGGGVRPIHDVTDAIMDAFIAAHRAAYGVEPMYRVVEIAPSAYDVYRQRQADVTMRTELVLAALEQAVHDRARDGRRIVRTARGSRLAARGTSRE